MLPAHGLPSHGPLRAVDPGSVPAETSGQPRPTSAAVARSGGRPRRRKRDGTLIGSSKQNTISSNIVCRDDRGCRHEFQIRSSGSCGVSLVKQLSQAECVNTTAFWSFGCSTDHTMFVSNRCRGQFLCNGRTVACGKAGAYRDYEFCACDDRLRGADPARPQPHLPAWRPDPLAASGAAAASSAAPPPSDRAVVSVLVAVVAGSSGSVQRRTLRNLRAAEAAYQSHRTRFTWAVVAYDDGAARWEGARREAARTLRDTTLLPVRNASPTGGPPLPRAARKARLAHQRALILSVWSEMGRDAFDAVWLPDDDLRFDQFELAEFMHRWLCAHEGGPPIVSQPTIQRGAGRGDVGKGWLQSGETWKQCMGSELAAAFPAEPCFLADAVSMRAGFVEGQAALLDAEFAGWFLEQPLVARVVQMQLAYGVETGPDAIWCGAAEDWATAHPAHRRRTACAIFPVPIGHDNTLSLASKNDAHYLAGWRLLHEAGIRRCARRPHA